MRSWSMFSWEGKIHQTLLKEVIKKGQRVLLAHQEVSNQNIKERVPGDFHGLLSIFSYRGKTLKDES